MSTSNFPIDIAQLVGMFMANVFYGIFLVTFFKCIRVLSVTPEGQLKALGDIRWKMLIPAILLFVFASLDVAYGLRHNIEAFIYFQGDPIQEFTNLSNWLVYMKMVNYVAQTFIGDTILIYRCWIIYSKNFLVIVPSVILWLGTTACGIATCYFEASQGNESPDLLGAKLLVPFITSMLALTLATNVVTTALIVYQLWSIQREARYFSPDSSNHSPLDRVIRLVIESGLMYTSSIIILFGLYISSNNAQFGVSDAVVQIIGITFNLIIVRVDRGQVMQPKSSGYPSHRYSGSVPLELSIHVQTTTSRLPAETESQVSPHEFKQIESPRSPEDRVEWVRRMP